MLLAINIGIDPILFHIGSFAIGWHAIMVILAVIVGVGMAVWLAMGAGIERSLIYSMAPWAVLGGIIGARLVHVIDFIDPFYIDHPVQILKFWEPGLSLFGAILGGTLAAVIYARVRRIPIGGIADLAAPGMLLAQAVGRIGCTINGDAYGTPTSLPWGFTYTHPNAAATTQTWPYVGHPAPVYEIIWDLIVFAIIWKLRGRLKPDGSLFLLYLSIYSVGRFLIEFIRALPQPANQITVGPLHEAHFICLAVLLVCVPLLIYRMRRARMLALA